MSVLRPVEAPCPVRVPLATEKLGILATLRAGRRNVLELIPELATHAPIISGRTGKRWHMVMDPDALRHILRDRVEDYPKSDVTKLILGPAIGESLFVAEGREWLWQRRTAAPVFSHRNVAALAPVMTAAAERASDRIGAAAGRAVNAFDEMVTATFEVISDVTFSGDSAFDRDLVHRSIEAFIDDSARVSLLDVIGAPAWVPRPERLFAKRQTDEMKRLADAAIDRHRIPRRADAEAVDPASPHPLGEGADDSRRVQPGGHHDQQQHRGDGCAKAGTAGVDTAGGLCVHVGLLGCGCVGAVDGVKEDTCRCDTIDAAHDLTIARHNQSRRRRANVQT